MLNRREQVAVALLCAALLAGSGIALVDYYRQDRLDELRVISGAVTPPVVAAAGAGASPQPAAPGTISPSAVDRGPAAPLPAPPAAAEAPAAEAPAIAPHDPGPLDLNQATLDDLQSLPGIGPTLAARILAFRAQHGAFASIEALRQVHGIGPRTLERIAPLLRVAHPDSM